MKWHPKNNAGSFCYIIINNFASLQDFFCESDILAAILGKQFVVLLTIVFKFVGCVSPNTSIFIYLLPSRINAIIIMWHLSRVFQATTKAMPVLWEAIVIFMVHSAAVSSDQHRGEVCRGNRDEFGFALVGHDYKSSYADNVGRCFFLCSSDERCQSATFFWNTKDCKMNRETKASRPADFVKNPSATYIENYFRGNVNYRLK